ncbi:MAG TPA: LysM peptidoglycan-binding domain-containing protein [Bryobacteraceae bacterium]|jgi:nucleoid-associated protein YgaU
MPNPKNLMDMAFNTAILGAFACEAPEIAFLAGVAQFVIDLAWPGAQTPTQCAPVDHAYLTAAIDDLRSEITDAIWNAALDTHTQLVIHHNDNYWSFLKEFQQMGVDTDPQSDGKLDAYFTLETSQEYPLKDLDLARLFLSMDSANDAALTPLQLAEHYTNNIGLYGLIGSTMLTYLKTCVAWNRARLAFPYVQYEKYKLAKAKWDALTAKQQQDHPELDPAPVANPNPNGKTPFQEWAKWTQREESGVPKLVETANTLIEYAEGKPATPAGAATKGLQVEMLEHWNAALANIQARLDKVKVLPPVPDDDDDGYGYGFGVDPDFDWDPPYWIVDDQLNYPYVKYTVQTGDTLAAIAQSQLQNSSRWPEIYHLNSDAISDSNVISAGQVLRIPHYQVGTGYPGAYRMNPPSSRALSSLDYGVRAGALMAYEWEAGMETYALTHVTLDDITDFGKTIQLWKKARASVQFTPHSVVAGETLLSIAGNDATLADKYYKFNSDACFSQTLTSPTQTLVAGMILNIPDASVLSDI